MDYKAYYALYDEIYKIAMRPTIAFSVIENPKYYTEEEIAKCSIFTETFDIESIEEELLEFTYDLIPTELIDNGGKADLALMNLFYGYWFTLRGIIEPTLFEQLSLLEDELNIDDNSGHLVVKAKYRNPIKNEILNKPDYIFNPNDPQLTGLFNYLFNELNHYPKTRISIIYHYFKINNHLSYNCTQSDYMKWVFSKHGVPISKIFPLNYKTKEFLKCEMPIYEQNFRK